jgi:hypothetical protein
MSLEQIDNTLGACARFLSLAWSIAGLLSLAHGLGRHLRRTVDALYLISGLN